MEKKMHRFNGKPLSFLLSSKEKRLNYEVLSRALKISFFFFFSWVFSLHQWNFILSFPFSFSPSLSFFFLCVPQGIYLSSIIRFVLKAAVCEHALHQQCSDKSGERFAWRCFDMFKVSYSIMLGIQGAGGEQGMGRKAGSSSWCCIARKKYALKESVLLLSSLNGEERLFFVCARECNYWFRFFRKKKKCSFQGIQFALISRKIHTSGLGLFKMHHEKSVSHTGPIFSFILISFFL